MPRPGGVTGGIRPKVRFDVKSCLRGCRHPLRGWGKGVEAIPHRKLRRTNSSFHRGGKYVLAKDIIVCTHCGKEGHTVEVCWR